MTAVNEAEAFVHRVCRRTFLSLWSLENPIGPKQGKELADALIVSGEDIVLISVKDRNVKPSGDLHVDAARWYRDAVAGSVKQLRGAHRALSRMGEVRRRDNPEVTLGLPAPGKRRLHFVAVALGGDDLVTTRPEQHDFGLVHVFDRSTFEVVLSELDTVTDFVTYLRAKEILLAGSEVVLEDGEWDLLAVYLRGGRKFPSEPDALFLAEGLWQQVVAEPAFERRKQADRVSYTWDKLIEEFAGHLRRGTLLGGAPIEVTEVGLRHMARESRFQRRLLGDAFIVFLRMAAADETQSRHVVSPSGVLYVFVVCPRGTPSEARGWALRGYCSILLERHPHVRAVVGLMTEKPEGDWRPSFATLALEAPVTDEVRTFAAQARAVGILSTQVAERFRTDEYPTGSGT